MRLCTDLRVWTVDGLPDTNRDQVQLLSTTTFTASFANPMARRALKLRADPISDPPQAGQAGCHCLSVFVSFGSEMFPPRSSWFGKFIA